MPAAPFRFQAPAHFPVSVILERKPAAVGAWVSHLWRTAGIVVGDRGNHVDLPASQPELIRRQRGVQQFAVHGLRVTLHDDQCESYYHNLMTATAKAYVVANVIEADGERRPQPFLVSLSFDEAHAYLEGDEDIDAVAIPPELYRWAEGFVLARYAPEKKTKRRLNNWKSPEAPT